MCSPMPLRRRGPRRPPPKPPPTRLARAKPALEISAHSKILETTIRSPVTPTPARRSSRCAHPQQQRHGRAHRDDLRARALTDTPVWIRGSGQALDGFQLTSLHEDYAHWPAMQRASASAYKAAGVGARDIDVAEVH